MEFPQLQCVEEAIDGTVVQVPRVQVVEKTVEGQQLQIVGQIVETPETQTLQGGRSSERSGTAPVRQVPQMGDAEAHPTGVVKPGDPDAKIKFFVKEVPHGVGGFVFDAHGNRVANDLGRCELCDRRDVERQISMLPRCEHGGLLMTGIASITLDVESRNSVSLGATPCRGYRSACLEDGRINRSHHPGFLENGPGSRWKTVLRVSERQVLGRSSWQDEFREEVLPQRHFGSRFHSRCGGCSRSGAGLYRQ